MNVVSFGGGTNSTAMIIEMYKRNIPIDLILFADTGAEMPNTYEYINVFNKWLTERNLPQITTVENVDKDGNRLSLEEHCLKYNALPSIVYGFKKCSVAHKINPQDKYCNNNKICKDIWKQGQKIYKYVGYDAGEERRKTNAHAIDIQDKKYNKVYALIDWEIYREDCEQIIIDEGLPLPGKSSCFFCPSMKKREIKELEKNYPELFKRAIALEENAKDNLLTVKGLGRNWSWKDYIEAEKSQIGLCSFLDPENTAPCGCYD